MYIGSAVVVTSWMMKYSMYCAVYVCMHIYMYRPREGWYVYLVIKVPLWPGTAPEGRDELNLVLALYLVC